MKTPTTEGHSAFLPAPLATSRRGRLITAMVGLAVAAVNVAGGLACSGWRHAEANHLDSPALPHLHVR